MSFGDLGVVDDHDQRGGREDHQREDLDELAQDVAVDDVRKRDVEPDEDLRLVMLGDASRHGG